MKLKLDENLPRQLAAALQPLGHDVDSVADEGLLAKPDVDVAGAASSAGRMILTLDLDFSDIRRFPPGTHPGIILFRPRTFAYRDITRFIEAFVQATNLDGLAGCLVVVDPYHVRVRRPPS